MIRKLRKKFIAAAMLSVCVVLAVIMGTVNILNYRKIIADADNVLHILTENGGSFPEKGFGKPDIRMTLPDPPGDISPETPFETRYFTVTFDADGTVSDMNTGSIAAVETSDILDYVKEAGLKGKDRGFAGNYRFARTVTEEGAMYIFVDCRRPLATFLNFLRVSIAVSFAGILSFLVLVIFFSRRVFGPVEESYRKQKRFITDAGHELKTPLTIIDANVEVLDMENGKSKWTDSIRNQTKRLADLTNDLVTLSRLDESGEEVQMVDFSLTDAVLETLETFAAPALTQEKILENKVEPNLSIRGDEKRIRQMVSLLMENALKYSSEHGRIEVVLRKKGRGKQLVVSNTSDQIKAGSLDYLMERFYREDASRNSQTGGYGIGLSIVQAIVRAHKGKIHIKSEDGKTFQVEIYLN